MAEKQQGKKTSKSASSKVDSKGRGVKSDNPSGSIDNMEESLPNDKSESTQEHTSDTASNDGSMPTGKSQETAPVTAEVNLSNEKQVSNSLVDVVQDILSEGRKGEDKEKESGAVNWKNTTNNHTPPSVPLTCIHLIDGEKGGVGKSFFTRVLMHYLEENKISDFVLVDADNTNPDVFEVYGGERINFSENEFKAYAADRIIELALSQSVVVNLPAQVYPIVKDWIINNDLIALGQQPEANIKFVKWFVCTGANDSVKLFEESMRDFGHGITHIFIKNYSFTPDWSNVEINVVGDVREIKFPKLSPMERDAIVRNKLTFASAKESKDIKILGRQRLRNFLSEVFTEIDSVKDLLVSLQKSTVEDSFDSVKNLTSADPSSSNREPSSSNQETQEDKNF